ncbi:MAG: BON domain-containing protein [Pseudomonadota bacterium]|nr:BON domain-containing protein [Pseudomonadota bacterium]
MSNLSKYASPLFLACAVAAAYTAPAALAAADDSKGNTSRTVGTVVDDSVITGEVKAKLIKTKGVDALQIDVDTRSGVVQLTGTVKDPAQIALAEKVAGEVNGVKMVQNDLKVGTN